MARGTVCPAPTYVVLLIFCDLRFQNATIKSAIIFKALANNIANLVIIDEPVNQPNLPAELLRKSVCTLKLLSDILQSDWFLPRLVCPHSNGADQNARAHSFTHMSVPDKVAL